MAPFTPVAPEHRQNFEIALICALPLEADLLESVFDKFWEDDGKEYGKANGDPNSYTTGVLAGHNVVLAHMPGMGKVNAAAVASTLRISYSGIKLAIVVGICGGVPQVSHHNEEIILGDVVISQALVQYDFGRQYSEIFARKDTIEDSLGRPPLEIRSILAKLQTLRSRQKMREELMVHLETLQSKVTVAKYPGVQFDKLYDSSYVHKHQESTTDYACRICDSGQVCEEARHMNCDEVGCDDSNLIGRERLASATNGYYTPNPMVHFGRMGSGDSVMKSGKLRDKLSSKDGLIAFEMEGAGLWEYFPSIVVKGVSDYADSHKTKSWQRYAAATAACCVKALLRRWTHDAQPIEPIQPVPVDPDVARSPIWHCPFDILQNFIGREKEIQLLKTRLFGVNQQRRQRMAVFGLGGVGKSRIAWELASYARSLGQYSVFWVQATSLSTLENDFLEIGEKLQISQFQGKTGDIKELITQHLSKDTAGKWLMILDNADDESLWDPRPRQKTDEARIVDYIPRSSLGSVFITTRSRRVAVQLAGQGAVELQQMSSIEAVETLKSVLLAEADDTVAESSETMLTLVDHLSYFPLAIVQAASFINVNGLSIREYLDLLNGANEEDIVELLSEDFEDETRYPQAPNAIASTWLISFKQIQRKNPRAIDFLSHVSCLYEKDIPQSLLPEPSSKKELADILGILTGYSFIRKQTQERLDIPLYDVHRLVRLATRNWLRHNGTLRSWTETALEHMLKGFPSSHYSEKDLWSLYMPHAETLCAASDGWDWQPRYDLLNKIALCQFADGAYSMAIKNLSSAIAWRIEKEGDLSLHILGMQDSLGRVLIDVGRYDEAEDLLQKTFKGRKELLGAESPATLITMGRLATLCIWRDEWEKAEKIETEVMEISKRVMGLRNTNTLASMGSLAGIYRHQERYTEAELLESQVLEASREVNGIDHPDTLASISSLAKTYKLQGRVSEAENLFRDLVERNVRVRGTKHPDTLLVKDDLALIYIDQERFDEAEQVFAGVPETSRKMLGDNHPDTLGSFDTLGLLHRGQQRWMEAEQLQRRLLEDSLEAYGPKRPIVLIRLDNLKATCRQQNNWGTLMTVLDKLVQASTAIAGPEDQITLSYRAELGIAYLEQERDQAADEIIDHMLQIFGDRSNDMQNNTIGRIEDLGAALMRRERVDRGCDVMEGCLKLSTKFLGSEHKETERRRIRLARWEDRKQPPCDPDVVPTLSERHDQ